jgi:pilus assembly protein Flp/PilA
VPLALSPYAASASGGTFASSAVNNHQGGKMKQVSRILVDLHRNESGQDLIEYALVAALIAFAAVAGMNYVASAINNAFSAIGNKLSNAIS